MPARIARPVTLGEQVLVDGGVMDNLAIDTAELTARITPRQEPPAFGTRPQPTPRVF